jgi:hypothetical protein
MLPVTATGTGGSLSRVRATRSGKAPAVAKDYLLVRLLIAVSRLYGRQVTTLEADSFDELIDDCAQLPTTMRDQRRPADDLVTAPAWQVSEGCLDQVRGLDEYV